MKDCIHSSPFFRIFKDGTSYFPIDFSYSNFEFSNKPSNPDILEFNVNTPILEEYGEEPIEYSSLSNGRPIIKINLMISSPLDYQDVYCKYEPLFGIEDAHKYKYKLLILENDNFVDSGIEITFDGEYLEENWIFTIKDLPKGNYYFQIY